MYKNGFGINNLQWLMCHKTQPNQTKPEEGRRIYQPKCCESNTIDEVNSLNILNDKNHQTSSQKF